MKKVGIVAEYNPFHRGHAWHLLQTRQALGECAVIAVMSGNFVQRGDCAITDKWARAAAALAGEAEPTRPTVSERVDTAVLQIETAAAFKGERVACLEARRHFAWYLKGVPHAGFFRDKIVKVETLSDIYKIGEQIKRELG